MKQIKIETSLGSRERKRKNSVLPTVQRCVRGEREEDPAREVRGDGPVDCREAAGEETERPPIVDFTDRCD